MSERQSCFDYDFNNAMVPAHSRDYGDSAPN